MSKFIELTTDHDGQKSLVNTSSIIAVLQVPDKNGNCNVVTVGNNQTIMRESFAQVKKLLEVSDE